MEDGWTSPIVALPSGEIVDGFHRWTISEDPDIWSLTDGLVPVVRVEPDRSHQKMTTIRQNRARGQHGVLPMAEIVRSLVDDGLSTDEIRERLQMEPEEVDRLIDASGMPNRAGDDQLGRGWVPE